MSVRSDPKEMSPGMQQALLIPQDVMRTAAQQSSDGQLMVAAPTGTDLALSGNGVGNEQHLAQANEFNTSNPNHPLKRTVVINIRSSLSDLCLRGARATWSPPSAEATKAIFQQAPSHRTFKHPPPPAPPLMKQVETNNTSTNENKQVRASVQLRGTWPLFKRTDSRFVAPVRSLQTLTRLVNRTV